jgi:hypothetical protein
MNIVHLLLCFLVTAIGVLALHRYSTLRLRSIQLISGSRTALSIFLYARLVYWYIFAVMITAFLLGMYLFSAGGNETRQIIAYKSAGPDNVPTFVVGQLSNVFLPLIFITLFISMISIGLIGRNVLKQMPEDGRPGETFTRFRFTFVLMTLSLILPPLAFGALLLL